MPSSNTSTFDCSTWKRGLRDRRKEREKSRLAMLDNVDEVLQKLSDTYQWEQVYLFGSVIRPGQFTDHSDLDIGIEGLDKFMLYRFIADCSGMLGRSVDVIRLEECDFATVIKERGIPWKKRK